MPLTGENPQLLNKSAALNSPMEATSTSKEDPDAVSVPLHVCPVSCPQP